MEGRSSPFRWLAGCIIATHDAQPKRTCRSSVALGVSVSCAHCAGQKRQPRSTRACRAVSNARQDPTSVRLVHSRDQRGRHLVTDDVLRNDRPFRWLWARALGTPAPTLVPVYFVMDPSDLLALPAALVAPWLVRGS
jgi:hypothetical protein